MHEMFQNVNMPLLSEQGFTQLHGKNNSSCSGISPQNRRRKYVVSHVDRCFRHSSLIILCNRIQQELIFHLYLFLVPGYICLDYLSNIRSGISEELSCCSLSSGLLRDTWRSLFSLLQVSKLCYSYALETKRMFSSRLLREPTCYFHPVTSRRGMTALFFFCFLSLSLSL